MLLLSNTKQPKETLKKELLDMRQTEENLLLTRGFQNVFFSIHQQLNHHSSIGYVLEPGKAEKKSQIFNAFCFHSQPGKTNYD